MRILITGGSGDLGTMLSYPLHNQGHHPVCLDFEEPKHGAYSTFIKSSILDRVAVTAAMKEIDCVVHIAALHGIHEFRQSHDVYQFWDVNATGTQDILEGAANAGIRKFVFISSSSVKDFPGVYATTKVVGETLAKAYSERHSMNVISLRPRAFIPPWNRTVYSNYIEWANWFWGGAVHINDVVQGVLLGIEYVANPERQEYVATTLDGAYEYTDNDLENWDIDGAGSTFMKYYSRYYDIAIEFGLNPTRKPTISSDRTAGDILGYRPSFSLRALLDDLVQYGKEGPPLPNLL